MDAPSLTDAVRRELLAHPDVTERPHRFGGIVFHLAGYELGHLHGETVADLPLPPSLRDELVASGRVRADEVASGSAWISRRVHGVHFGHYLEHSEARAALAGDAEARETAPDPDAEPTPTWLDAWASRSRRIARRRSRSR